VATAREAAGRAPVPVVGTVKDNKELAALYPHAHCELDFSNPLELAVATKSISPSLFGTEAGQILAGIDSKVYLRQFSSVESPLTINQLARDEWRGGRDFRIRSKPPQFFSRERVVAADSF